MLERNEVAHGYVEGAGEANEDIDSDIGLPALDFPEVGAAGSRHKREFALRDAATLARLSNPESQVPLFMQVLHPFSIRALRYVVALYRVSLGNHGSWR